ncbi:MAG: CHASE2 domain-containing protein [Anaerolineae bacterium]|nr:CHASE2 domain-containing protein [Anaerolineae bacterium]
MKDMRQDTFSTFQRLLPAVRKRLILSRRRRLRHGTIIAIVVTALMLAVFAARLFHSTDLTASSLLYVPSPLSDKIVIVAIDDISLGAYGRSVAGWSRQLHADLVKTLSSAGARVVAFDVIFAESTDADAAFADAIRTAQQTGRRTRTVLATAGKQDAIHAEPDQLIRYDQMLVPVAPLQDAAAMVGHVNLLADADSRVRRMPLVIQTPEQRWLSVSAAIYLSYLRIPAAAIPQVVTIEPDMAAITPQRLIPVDRSAQMMINYFGAAKTFPIYSYRAVHDGEVDLAVFQDKIVLVGALNASGITDRYLVPISLRGEPMAGVEILANAVETLIQNKPLQPQSQLSEVMNILFMTLLGGLILGQMRWYLSLTIYFALLTANFLLASVIFSTLHIVVTLLYPALGLTLVMVGTLIMNIQWEGERRRQIQRLLKSAGHVVEERLVLEDVLRRIADEIALLLDYPDSGIWLWDDESNQVKLLYWRAPTQATPPPAIKYTVGKALISKQLIVEDTMAAVPLMFQNRPLGAVVAIRDALPFSHEQLTLLQLFAEQVAPALANSRLYTSQLRQRELFEAILGSTPDPVIVLGADNQLIHTNPAAVDLLHVKGELSGRQLTDVARSVQLTDEHMTAIRVGMENKEPFRLELTINRRTFILQGAPLRKTESGWVFVLNDVSPLKELDALKTQMIRMASHDLKSPLGAILGYAELLKTTPLSDFQLQMINVTEQAAQQMLAIITNILNLERLKDAQLSLVPIDLNRFVDQLVAVYQERAASKQQSVVLQMPDAAITVQADRQYLHQAIDNLIGNAVKYTPAQGKITVTISGNNGCAHITVADTGCGIPAQAQAKMFQPFFRARTRATADIPGSGLGLSLAKAVIEAHQGKLWFESEEERGSTFFVELPLAPAAVTPGAKTPG